MRRRHKPNRNLKRVYQEASALDCHLAGKTLFYSNRTTERAVLRYLKGNWCFQYTYDTPAGVMNGSIKFVRPSVRETLKAFFAVGGSRSLFVEEPASGANNNLVFYSADPDEDEFGITIKVPKGTKVTIIEV